MKTIGIDARFYGEAGPGRYTKAIIEHLEKIDNVNKYYVYLRKKGFDNFNPTNQNFIKVLADYQWYSFDEQVGFLIVLLKRKLDLLYVPHFNIPVLYPRKMVTAIPDLIMHKYSTEKGTTLPKPYFMLKKVVYKAVFWWAVVRSSKIIVPSKDVMEDFKTVYPSIAESKYILAYEGVDPDFMQLKEGTDPQKILDEMKIKKPYLLYVSSAYEHKNLPRLLEAFEILMNQYNFEGQLVIVGKNDKFSQKIKSLIKDSLKTKILMPGLNRYVTDQEIVALRINALAYVFPSLKEGFSLTPMEAQTVGVAAVISNIPVHKEIYENSVLYFDPLDTQDIAHKINELITNDTLKEDLIKKGYEKVKEYSWNDTARITYEVFDKLLQLA